MNRNSNVSRCTSETDITIEMNLDGEGVYDISTGVNFFNHMLEAFSKHSMIDLNIDAKGDIAVDDHHTVEDVGILMGEAFSQAVGDKKGIKRMARTWMPKIWWVAGSTRIFTSPGALKPFSAMKRPDI